MTFNSNIFFRMDAEIEVQKSSGKWQLRPYKAAIEEVGTCIPPMAELAYFAASVYYDEGHATTIKNLSEEDGEIKPISEDWILLSTAYAGPPGISLINGYYGATYFNIRTKVLVVAHRGTHLLNPGSVLTDIIGVISSFYAPQTRSAFKYTQEMVDTFGPCSTAVYVSGHSLGGWLSQTSTFFYQFPQYRPRIAEAVCDGLEWFLRIVVNAEVVGDQPPVDSVSRLHCIVFESPGTITVIEKFGKDPGAAGYLELITLGNLAGVEDLTNIVSSTPLVPSEKLQRNVLNWLDVTNFLAEVPSDINCIKQHLGDYFTMSGVYGHSSINIVKFWQQGHKELGHVDLRKASEWPLGVMLRRLTGWEPKTEPSSRFRVKSSFFTLAEFKILFHVSEIPEEAQELDWSGLLGTQIWNDKLERVFSSYKFKTADAELEFKEDEDVVGTLCFFKHIFQCAPDLGDELETKFGKSKGWESFEEQLGKAYWDVAKSENLISTVDTSLAFVGSELTSTVNVLDNVGKFGKSIPKLW